MKFSYSILLLVFLTAPLLAQKSSERDSYAIKIDPIFAIAPIKTQQVVIVTVLDRDGNPLPGKRVDWMVQDGIIVDHDDMGAIINGRRVDKISNNYSTSYTNERAIVLTRGTKTLKDDIKLGVGQTWLTISSAREGKSNILALCPTIRNTYRRLVFASYYWQDAQIEWPQNAIAYIGDFHILHFALRNVSTGTFVSVAKIFVKKRSVHKSAFRIEVKK